MLSAGSRRSCAKDKETVSGP